MLTTNSNKIEHILVVDDTPEGINVLKDLLEGEGYEISCALSGEEAIDVALDSTPNLILLDVMMPRMNGFETCIKMKKNEILQEIPIIFITAAIPTTDEIEKGFQVGAVDYIRKPFQIQEISIRVRTQLDIQYLHKETKKINERLNLEILERSRMGETLRESERKLKTLMGNLPGMAFRCQNNMDWKMEFVSDRGFELTGYNPKDLITNKIAYGELILKVDRQYVWDKVQEAINDRKAFELKYRILTAEGNEIHVLKQGEGVFDTENNLIAIEGFITDITEQETVKKKLENAKNKATSANEAKSIFLANMSHEIRTPMNSILGYAQILNRDSELSALQLEKTQSIERSGRYLLSLIDQILDITKIEKGILDIYNEDFDLAELINGMYEMFYIGFQKKNIDWKVSTNFDRTQPVYGDMLRLRQVMINLLGNAQKFTDKGNVELSVRYQEKDRYIFNVTDSGRGISSDNLPLITDRFFQVKSHTYCGTGLGLPYAKQLVELMGGRLLCQSELNIGSSFFFHSRVTES